MKNRLDRRKFLELTSATFAATAAWPSSAATIGTRAQSIGAAQPAKSEEMIGKRHNLIIFVPDEMRADSLACFGNPITKTPNYDRLASEGARFDNCHVQYPVCGASRCAMLTGWPTSVRGHRSLYYFLRPDEPNLFRYLRRAGYDVFWFGKNDALAAQSFHDSVTEWANQSGSGAGPGAPQSATPNVFSMLYTAGGDRRSNPDYKHLQMAVNVLKRKQADKPFCIFLPLFEPHPPYTVPEDFYNMYSPDTLPPLVPPGLKKKPDFHAGIRSQYGLDKLSSATFRKIRSVYYGQVSFSDWILGELLEALESTGHRNDTALLVTSDHGDYAGDYGLVEKWPSGLEDCLTRVPLIARVPGGRAGSVDKNMVEMYDIMQTCLDIAGVDRQQTHTHFSRSLLPQIAGGAGDSARAAFAEGGYNIYEPQCFEPPGAGGGPYGGKIALESQHPLTVSRAAMVRTQTHKLIRRPQGQSELYNIAEDPGETINLYGEAGSSDLQSRLHTKLLDHFLNTSGVAPMDKDQRDSPPFYLTQKKLGPPEASAILDL